MSLLPIILTLNNISSRASDIRQSLLYDGTNVISEWQSFNLFVPYQSVKSGAYYFIAMMKKGGPPNNRMVKILKYNSLTNLVEQEADISTYSGVTSAYDTHPNPTINVDSNGTIFVTRERSGDSTGYSDNHQTNIMVHRTTTPGDLSTLTLTEVTATHSYIKSWISPNDDLYVFGRGDSTSVIFENAISYFKSTNGGVSFGSQVRVVNYNDSGLGPNALYHQFLSSEDGNFYLLINERDQVNSEFRNIMLLKTSDWVTWSNMQGTFSKNVVSSGYITRTEVYDNCLVYEVAVGRQVIFDGGYVDSNSNLKMLISGGDSFGGVVLGNKSIAYDEMNYITYDSGWVFTDISEIISGNTFYFVSERYVGLAHGGNIYFVDHNGDKSLYLYTSNDDFTTYSRKLVVQGNSNYKFGTTCANDGNFCTLIDVQGDQFDTTDYSNSLLVYHKFV